MSKFDYSIFYGGFDELAVSKEKYTKKEAIEIAKAELELEQWRKPYYLCVSDGFVRHRAGINEDGEPCVRWWLEYKEHKRSCPCWLFHTRAVELIDNYSFEKEYEHILIE